MDGFVKPIPMDATNFYDAERAVHYLDFLQSEAISLKLRPVRWDETRQNLWDAFVYQSEYARAHMVLNGLKLTGTEMGERATLIQAADQKGMIIEHETGPEAILIAQLALATATVGLVKEVFCFFIALLKIINETSAKKKSPLEPANERNEVAEAVSLELRINGHPKLVGGIVLPVTDDKDFEKFLLEGFERAKNGEEWEGFKCPKI